MKRTALGLTAALVGCASPTPQDSAANAVRPSAAIALLPLEASDGSALAGELRCSFARADGRALLIVAADVGDGARASAVVRNAGGAIALTGRDTGGFGALERGTTLTGDGMTVEIARGVRRPTGTEETRFDAVLSATAADGASRSQRGIWSCGP